MIHVIAQLNPFNTERTEFDTEQKIISEIIKEIDTQKVINTGWRVLIDDEIITDFNRHVPDESTLYIKIVPEGDNKEAGAGMKIGGTFLTVIGVVIAVATSWTGIGAFIGMAMVGAGVGLLAGGVALYNLDIPSLDREQPEQSPSIRGSRNQLRQLGILPYLFGTRRIYADLAATSYTWVDSNGDQYLYQLFCAGQKDIEIDKKTIKVGDTLLENYTSGTIESILDGTDPLIHMQISHGTDLPPLVTTCIHEEQKNAIIKNKTEDGIDGSVIWTTPSDTEEINVDIFFYNGLGKYNDDNDVVSTSVSVTAKYKRADEDDSKYQTLGFFSGSSSTISGSELKTKRYAIHKKGLAAGQYTIKISRETADSEDNKVIDAVYVGSFRAIKNTAPVSKTMCKKITLIGLKIKASEKLSSVIEQLNFIASAKMPVYSSSQSGAAAWQNTRVTANPAACALAVMRSEFSQQKLTDKDIDWQRFADWYTWCDNHGYTCNEYITQSMAISEILSAIASTSRGEILRYNGRITVIQDIARSAAVQLFTPRNSHDYAESIQFADIPDAMAIGFVDKESGFAENELTIYNTPSGNKTKEPETTQDITLWGVTDSVQARKLGMYKYAVSKNRPVVYKFSCDIEYLLCTKGDWIKYAGDVALAGIKQGRIVSIIIDDTGSCTGFTSDEILPMEADKNYACRIRKNTGEIILVQLITAEGSTSNVTFAAPLIGEVIHAGDLFAFGIVGNETIDLIITDIQCGDDLSATITAVDYAPDIFGVDDPGFILPEYKNKISDVPGAIDSGNITDWQTWYTFNDSKSMPSRPSGDGSQNGWHRIPTSKSLWQSSKTASSISEGEWSTPIPTAENVYVNINEDLKPDAPPDVPTAVHVKANMDSLTGNCSYSDNSKNNIIVSVVWELSKNNGKTWQIFKQKDTLFNYLFDRNIDGYPESTDFSTWKIRVKFINSYGFESDYNNQAGISIDVSDYGTWIPPNISTLTAKASQNSIDITAAVTIPSNVYGAPFRYEFGYSSNGTSYKTETTEISAPQWFFDRDVEGYPEKSDLADYRIRCRLVSAVSGKASASYKTATVDTSDYLTWIPSIPDVRTTASGRTAVLEFVRGDFYGFAGYRVQISQNGSTWYKPGDSADAYTNEAAWRDEQNGYAQTTNAQYTQVLPLSGQARGLPTDTTYIYRALCVVAVPTTSNPNAVRVSSYSAGAAVLARATSAADIVAGAIGEAQLANSSVTADKIPDKTITGDKLVAKTITAENLSVLAFNKVNSFVDGTDEGWKYVNGSGSFKIISDDELGLHVCEVSSTNGTGELQTNKFEVLPDAIYELKIGIKSTNTVSTPFGVYLSIHTVESGKSFKWDFDEKKWVSGISSGVLCFVSNITKFDTRFFTTYILGSNADINDCPAPLYTDETYAIYAIKLNVNEIALRIPIRSSGTKWRIITPQVYQIGSGKIVANQVLCNDLTAIAGKFGYIDTERIELNATNWLTSTATNITQEDGSVYKAKAGEVCIGTTTKTSGYADSDEFFHYIPGSGFFFKIATFIVTSIASILSGIVRVKAKGATDANSTFIVNPTTAADSTTGTPAESVRIRGGQYNMLELKRKDANGSSMKFSNSSKKLGAAGFTSGGNFVVDGTDDADGSGNMLKIDQSGNQTVTGSETVNKDLTVKGNANLPFINTSSRGAQTVKNYYTVDLSALSTTNWYPVTFYSSDLELDCEIHGHNTLESAAFNQNIIHFLLTSQGWSDTPVRLTVLNWGAYSTTELTIMMIVKGNHSGMNAVYLRGGQKYRFICNRTPTLRTSGITNGDESFPVVTTYTAGKNTTIMWRADLMASSGTYNQLQKTRFSGKVKAAAGLDVTGDATIDGALDVGQRMTVCGLLDISGNIRVNNGKINLLADGTIIGSQMDATQFISERGLVFKYADYLLFLSLGFLNFSYNGTITLSNSFNIKSVVREGVGVYKVYFKNIINLKYFTEGGKKYINVITVGHATSNWSNGFSDPIFHICNWMRNSIDGLLECDDNSGTAAVAWIRIYFVDNNQDKLIDLRSCSLAINGYSKTWI